MIPNQQQRNNLSSIYTDIWVIFGCSFANKQLGSNNISMLFTVGLSLFVSSHAFRNTVLNQNFTALNYPYITCSWALQSKSEEVGGHEGTSLRKCIRLCIQREVENYVLQLEYLQSNETAAKHLAVYSRSLLNAVHDLFITAVLRIY